jgi:transposase
MVEQTAELPDDVDGLRRLVVERCAERDLAFAALKLKTLEVEKLKLQLMKLRRMQFDRSSEKLDRAAAQLELAIERGRPGPGLLAHVLVSKYCDHLPLYRQSEIYAREGIELGRSTMAGWVGRAAFELRPPCWLPPRSTATTRR